MPFKPGVGGRPKGALNKSHSEVKAILQSRNINPLEKLLDLIPKFDETKQAHIYMHLMPYVYSRLKESEPEKPQDLSSLDINEKRLMLEKAKGAIAVLENEIKVEEGRDVTE